MGRILSFESKWARLGIARLATVVCSILLFLAVLSIQLPTSSDPSEDLPIPADSPEENEKMDTDPPVAPVLVSAVLEGPNNENVLISWSLSDDDGGGDNDVSHYAVYYSNIYDYNGEGYSYLGDVNKGETIFIHSLAGDGDWSDYFYNVQANDTSGNGNWSGQAGKFVRYLEEGKQLGSIPLIQEDTTLEVVLQSLDGSYKQVRYYKSSDQSDHWKTYWTFKTYRTLFDIDHKMSFWIDMTKDDHLVVVGLVPETTQIELGHNWNLVGYPSFIDRTVSDALAGIDWMKVQGWGATPPYHQKQMSASDILTAGEGYWVWVGLSQVWEVHNKPLDSPYIVWTDPPDGALDIPLNASIYVKFIEEMETTSIVWFMAPDPGPYSTYWSEGNTLLEVHFYELWPENTTIDIEVDGQDLEGNWLVPGPVPNPWSFVTVREGPPYVVMTDPYDGEVGVEVWRNVTIQFSREIVPATFHWNITQGPDPSGWSEYWSQTMEPNDTVVLSHSNPFAPLTSYCFDIEHARDIYGRDLTQPSCFVFGTGPSGVHIVQTDPFDGEIDVEVWGNVTIKFSKPMNTSSVSWVLNPFVGHQPIWSNHNMTLVLDHPVPYSECVQIEIAIYGLDVDGNPLVPGPVPNPFTFTTGCVGPYILITDPYHGEEWVPTDRNISIRFSEHMNTSSVFWTVTPDPGPGGWSQNWYDNDTLLVLSHSFPFAQATRYMVIVIDAQDKSGRHLIPGPVPNSWEFCTGVYPFIVYTYPANNSADIPLNASIEIMFSQPMNESSLIWIFTPNPFGWTETWVNETTVILNHSNLFDPFMTYDFVIVYVEDVHGFELRELPFVLIFTTEL